MINQSRCREKIEGKISRRRTYTCRECDNKFQVDTLAPLPEKERLCPYCRDRTYLFPFINKLTGKEIEVRASSAELATLRAWEINKNFTFKVELKS